MRNTSLIPLLCALALAAGPVNAQYLEAEDAKFVMTAGFLADHPDLEWRKRGIEAYKAGRMREAHDAFINAARYADKPSQAMLAEMLWRGDGVPRDRPQAYAWSDLAAERGWHDLLGKRESYWNQLDENERERAIEVGVPLLREYGDDAAKPRIDAKLRQARRRITGSRVGHVGNLTIRLPSVSGSPLGAGHDVDGSRYYADKYYEPKDYHAWHEQAWRDRGEGVVEVGGILDDSGDVRAPEED